MPDSEKIRELVDLAVQGDRGAMDQLLAPHRDRLRRMVAVRIDPRLAARVDPSDVVQETLVEASKQLADYLDRRTLPFYTWLRELAWKRLVGLYRFHVLAQRRSVEREQADWIGLSDDSALGLAGQLAATMSSPSERFAQAELKDRLQAALAQLSTQDREIIVMRHLEQLQVEEIAAILNMSPSAVKMRRMRAFERLRMILITDDTEDET